MADRPRSLLTVEEAAVHLRIGRTKAYALATEWRITGGKSGLPVIDLGHVLRVPRHQLELLIGGPLDDTHSDRGDADDPQPAEPRSETATTVAAVLDVAPDAPEPVNPVGVDEPSVEQPKPPATTAASADHAAGTTRREPRNRNNTQHDNQLNLFNNTQPNNLNT